VLVGLSHSPLLKENPFESPAVPMKGKIHWADRRKLLESLLSFIKAPPEKWTELWVLLGEYGCGKTHSLTYAKRICEEEKIPAVLLPNPGSSFTDILVNVVQAVGFEVLVSSCRVLLEKDKTIVMKHLEQDRSGTLTPESLSTEKLLRYIFPNMDLNFAMILNQLMNGRNIDLSKTWLMGKTMTSAELGRLNVSSAISSDDYAVRVLGDVIQILVSRSGKFVLLVDEMEDIGNMSKQRAISFAKAMRRFIDENIGGCRIIIAFTGEGFTQFLRGSGAFLGKKYPALTERLEPRIELRNFTVEETMQFIEDFIKSAYKGSLEKIITPKAIREIQKRTDGNPRKIVTMCHNLFAKAVSRDEFPISL
jgi:hypothetical protein